MSAANTSILLLCGKETSCDILESVVDDMPCDITMSCSVQESTDILRENPHDIIITEYELNGFTGIEFLNSIYDTCLKSTRIIVGKKGNEDLIIKAVIKGAASTYIEHSEDKELLRRKLEDIIRVRNSLSNEKLAEVFSSENKFPINMNVYETLMDAININSPIPEISDIISNDVTLTAKVLQVANSAFYGNFSGTSVEKAIIYMGLNTVKDIVLLHSLTANLQMNAAQNKKLEEIIRHSIITNYYFHAIAKKADTCSITVLNNSIGIIHDIGKLVQLVYFPMEHNNIEEFRKENPSVDYLTCELETGYKNILHSEIGAYFLRNWNFNQLSIEAALFHHNPEQSSLDARPCVETLFLANTIADIRDGFALSLDEAVDRCEKVDVSANDILKILPPF